LEYDDGSGSLQSCSSRLAGLVTRRVAMRVTAKARRGRENSYLFRPSRTRVPDELMYGGGYILDNQRHTAIHYSGGSGQQVAMLQCDNEALSVVRPEL